MDSSIHCFGLNISSVYIQLSLSMQAQSTMEVDSWICAIHSACASSFARQHGRDNTLRLMKSELHKMDINIDVVSGLPPFV